MKSRFRGVTIGIVALGLLAGCDVNADITTPPVAVEFSEGFDTERVLRTMPISFRTYAKGENGKLKKFAGANCRIKSQEFQTEFATTSFVEMPVIKGRPSILNVSCKAGDKQGSTDIKPGKPRAMFVGDPLAMAIANLASVAITAASDQWYYRLPDDPTIGVALE